MAIMASVRSNTPLARRVWHRLNQAPLSRHADLSNPSPEACVIRSLRLASGYVQLPKLSVNSTVGLIRIDHQRGRHVIASNGRQPVTQRRVSRAALKLRNERRQDVAAVRFLPRLMFVIGVIATPAQGRIVSIARHAISI